MTTIYKLSLPLPDCMMPDGGEACKGYHLLALECTRLRARIAMLEATLAAPPANVGIADIAESIVRCEATDFALATKSPDKSFDDQALSRTALKARIVKELAAQEISEAKVRAAAQAILYRRGFGFYTDPMEGGQDAYDISCEALEAAAREA